MNKLDKLAEKNPAFFIDLEDTKKLAAALRRKGHDLPLVAVACIYEVWSEEAYAAGWLEMHDYDRAAETLLAWMVRRGA